MLRETAKARPLAAAVDGLLIVEAGWGDGTAWAGEPAEHLYHRPDM